MAKQQKISMLPLVIGIFLVLLVFGSGTAGREARPDYDGDKDDFKLTFSSKQTHAVAGEPYWIRIIAENVGNDDGTMFVQCSLLDMNDHASWLAEIGLQSAVTYGTSTRDNCVPNEPFTQTAKVELDEGESELLKFSVIVPDAVGDDINIYCDAFEQCISDGDTYSSSSFRRPIQVIEDFPDDVEPKDELPPAACNRDRDCPGYYLGIVECVDGYCLDADDVPTECGDGVCEGKENKINCPEDCEKWTDFKLKEWVDDHRILVTGIAMVLIIIGAFGMYQPKKDNPFGL